MPFGAGRPNARASSVNATARLFSQSFSTASPPTLEKFSFGRVILQQPALADDLLLLGKDLVHVLAAQALVLDDDLGENIFRLAQRQAQRRLQQPLAARVVQINLAPASDLLHVGDDLVEHFAQILPGRLRDN